MNNERTFFTNEELKERIAVLQKIIDASQELIDTPGLSISSCFKNHDLHYFNTRHLLVSLDRVDLTEKLKPVDFSRKKYKENSEFDPEEQFYCKLFGLTKRTFQRAALPEDYKETAAFVLESVLSEKEANIIKLRCGFEVGGTLSGLTLEEIGEMYGVTRERIRQVEEKIYKKLRKQPYITLLKYGISEHKKIEEIKAKALEAEKEKVEEDKEIDRLSKEIAKEDLATGGLFLFDHIDTLDITNRTFNCLTKNKKNMIFDIYLMSNENILSLRNMGVASAENLINALDLRAKEHGSTYEEVQELCLHLVKRYGLPNVQPGKALLEIYKEEAKEMFTELKASRKENNDG